MGENARLKIILRTNGIITTTGIVFCQAIKKTLPKDIKIKIYKHVHTGPNKYAGGAHVGLINCEYQLYVFIDIYYHSFGTKLKNT